ncbi:hypothetical protein [Flavobacterium macrobrachii]|jgi:hypothetical protein|uniref:hypothetical protein n=1 Tax=Flavobacterium macrobrachii TaxID=591204 RepID=UPI0037BFCDF6
MKKIVLLGLLSFLFFSCQKEGKIENVERAFYYWKGNSLGQENHSQIEKLKVKKLYVKLFEVDYSETRGNFPYEKNRPSVYDFKELDSVKVVPTIFIKNGIFQYNDEKSLDKLADNIVFLINKYSTSVDYSGKKEQIFTYDEIQIDCDWTKSTKDKYFYLLKKIKALSQKELSCTLRLYPYKYQDVMGIPPVDKATLMCYNLIKPLSQKDKNSILDIEELKKYLNEKKSFPLHLDIALPTFYWTQLYQNNHFMQLIDLSTNEVKSFAKNVKPLWYQVEKDTSINYQTYLKVGDQLKCEDVSVSTIQEAISIIKKNVSFDKNTTISLFDLDSSTFKQYSNEEISSFYDAFTK